MVRILHFIPIIIAVAIAIFLIMILPVEAKTYILPSGMKYEVEEPKLVKRWFILPSGIRWLGEVLVPVAQAAELSIKEQILMYAKGLAQKYSIPFERLEKIIACESQFNPDAFNPKDTDGHPKYGLLQFYKPTFYGAEGKDIWNWKEQLEVGTKMMADGY